MFFYHGPRGLLADDLGHSFANGWYGFFDDDRAFMADWGFDPTTIQVPVSIWYGDADLMVPPSHGAWLSTALPSATRHFFTGEGHLSLLANRSDQLLDELTGVPQP